MFPSMLAYKYARAFLNTHDLSVDEIKGLDSIFKALQKYQNLLPFFSISSGVKQEFSELLLNIFKKFKMDKGLEKLLSLLVKQNRIKLIPQVLQAIDNLYKADNQIINCKVKSAIDLTWKQKTKIERFVKNKIPFYSNNLTETPWIIKGKSIAKKKQPEINFNYEIDDKLIAGIKLKIGFVLWEKSAEKTMREIHGYLVRKYHGH